MWLREPDYSALLDGGGPCSPMVVFDSVPRGARVRIARTYFADGDPWLQSKNESIYTLAEPTLTRARLGQGDYWVVFEFKDKRIHKHVIVTGPTVVKVRF